MSTEHDLSNPNVVRSLKGTINNPRVGEEAKAHAQELLDSTKTDSKMPDNGPTGSSSMATKEDAPTEDDMKDSGEIEGRGETNRVIGGYRATLKNPRVGEEAKEHAREVLEDMGVDVETK